MHIPGEVLIECGQYPELYNKVSNWLYKKFDLHSAELSLIITYYLIQQKEGE